MSSRRSSRTELKGPVGPLAGTSGNGSAAGPSQRQLRVAEEVRRVLADLFAKTEFRDPELLDVRITVTEVRISPDFRHATAFVCRLGRSDVEKVLPALKRVAPFLRTGLSRTMRTRVVPEIHFQPDTAPDAAMEMDTLLRSLDIEHDQD